MLRVLSLLCAALGISALEDKVGGNVLALVQWVEEAPTGFVHENIEIRRYNPGDFSSPFAVFAKSFIPAGEKLFVVPRDFLITAEGTEDQCDTVKNLVREMRLGNESRYGPYINYLLDQPTGQLPNSWSEEGQELLDKILTDKHEDEQFLPPAEPFGYTFQEECNEEKSDSLTEHAYLLVLQRSWDDVLIPLFDMLSHRNGKWLNTESDSVHYNTNDVVVKALRDIQAGEELYTSYNMCKDCGSRDEDYGTPEILRDYGFVEQYPQRWIFHQYENLAFDLDEIKRTDDLGESYSVMQVTWMFDKPSDVGIAFLETELERLEDLSRADFQEQLKVPANEEKLCREYLNALIIAIIHAIESASDLDHQCTEISMDSPGSCEVILVGNETHRPRYDSFEEEPDHLDYTSYLCKQGRSMEFPGYKVLEVIDSLYQKIAFFHDPLSKDTCFELDTVVQICGTYRAHYHEMVVHYTARFFDTVKRVLFVGGGDSMLLHEIIKYPSLELVVGLELDQQVTRGSFKHFGTQPHWDNEKVQWWYGDAAKSLLMLPKDYFGSFDMVLVDLSETVMSMTVTDGLDIFGALALLLKPDGIIVKNELYLEKFSEIFDYTVQVHFRDVPVICTQALIFGSYENDMLYKQPTNHETGNNLFVTPFIETKSNFDSWHDYRRRKKASLQKTCKSPEYVEEEPIEQKRSPGILMVLETENTSFMASTDTFKSSLVSSLEGVGVTVVKAVSQTIESDGAAVIVVLEEGYVVARRWMQQKYCAFDIHMWAAFESHENIKKAVIKLTGASGEHSVSSYRIVAGGMFGIKSWKEDEKSRGPRLTRECKAKEDKTRDITKNDLVARTVLKSALDLIKEPDYSALVFCGSKEASCSSLDIIHELTTGRVVPIWACLGIDLDNEYSLSAKLSCEKELLSIMREGSKTSPFRVVILDDKVSFEFGQIIHRVFKSRFTREETLDDNVVVIANSLNIQEEWRRAFLDRFRRDFIVLEPVFRAEVLFNSSDSSMEMGVTSSGDENFIENLLAISRSIEKETGLDADVRNVQGGLFKYTPNFKPSQFFLPKDYDQSAPLKQWYSQQPLGRQTVFQLEVEPLMEKVQKMKLITIDGKNQTKKYFEKVPRTDDTFKLSHTLIIDAIERVIKSMEDQEVAKAEVHEITTVGDGSIIVVLWNGGNAIFLWDGRIHVDINIFTQGDGIDIAIQFSTSFTRTIPRLATKLRDEQPRGLGRVVNFLKDVEPREVPHWA